MFLLYTLHKNNKLFSFSNKLNKIVKLKPCDATLRITSCEVLMTSRFANNLSPNIFDDVTLCKHGMAEVNAFIVFNSFSYKKNMSF